MGVLSALVPPTEHATVRRKAAQVFRDVCDIGPAAEQDEPEATRRLCMVVAAIAPELPLPRLSLLVRYAMWSILLDDQLDNPHATGSELASVQQLVNRALAGAATTEPLSTTLVALRDDLTANDATGAIVARWCSALSEAVSSGAAQTLQGRAVATGAAAPPSLAPYLLEAARSVNYRSFALALLIVRGTVLDEPQLDGLAAPLWHASRAVRLGNDLASFARDQATGMLNALALHTPDGLPLQQVDVRSQITTHMQAHDDLVTRTIRADSARALIRCLRLSVNLYLHSDLR